MMAIIGIIYDEPDPSTYEGVRLSVYGKAGVWHIGSPQNDLACALILAHFCNIDVVYSSSVDHFVMDGGDLGVFNE